MNDRDVLLLLQKIDEGYEPSDKEREALSSVESITWKDIEVLPASISLLTGLKALDVSGTDSMFVHTTGLMSIPQGIEQLAGLQRLDLSNTAIRTLPDWIGNLKSLESLDLSDTAIRTLPEGLGNLTGLRSLNLSYTRIDTLPESVGKMTNLVDLDLRNMFIDTLPEWIGNLTNLARLNLRYTGVSVLPERIGNLKDLFFLDLSHTRIEALPKTIGNLTRLESIVVGHTHIRTLPESFRNLQKLQYLALNHTQVSDLPEWIGDLTSLQQLLLFETRISVLPEAIGELKDLRELNLSHTRISTLPKAIGELKNLKELDLDGNKIGTLPETFGNLERLEYLYLDGTSIDVLPGCIGNLTSLRSLDLRDNRISTLPECIRNLTSLQHLALSHTRILNLPEWIGELTSLRTLELSGLRLSELPESLLSLNLAYRNGEYDSFAPGIYINDLELTNQPIEIFSQSRELIIEYYRANKESSPIGECKVVFLGDGGAGKSRIIDRLMHDGGISNDFDGESTPGICISSKKYQIGSEEIKLHFWDFGGQAIMHSMHRLFLTNRTLYVVVANARDNKANDQAWYWIRNIKSFACGAPVLLLVNQKDQNPSANVNTNGLHKEYPALGDVRIISALKDTKDEFNEEVRDVICRTVSAMETVHTPFSRSWLSLMNELQDMPQDYITSDVFYQKCREKGIATKEGILDEIIGWYQDLGVCFYSRKHPASRQYMVLKPRWLLNALYILIFNGRKYASNGIICEEAIYDLICEKVSGREIKKVWSDIRYEPGEIQYIINVLLNFELVYRLERNRFFIPMLCDENEPGKIDSFMSENVLHVSFEYAYLPENVLHRLMVRHGHELNTDVVWRTGAEFRSRRCGWTALVRIKDNCLDVFARADHPETHPVAAYLDMMRDSIYEINEGFGLAAEEYIAYRRDGLEDRFDYQSLIGSLEAGMNKIYSRVFKRPLNIAEILGIITLQEDRITSEVIEQMLSALTSMSERVVHLKDRNEVELTADFQTAIEAVLNDKFGLHIAREYTVGRSNKKLGETDLYFFADGDGKKRGLYILENKIIQNFTKQYRQLMGYLNPDYLAGITLSINKDRGWEEAYDFICDKLVDLQRAGGDFAPQHIERKSGKSGTKYVKTRHIVPETGLTMPVYHLVLQLSDEARIKIARKAR